MDEVTYIGAIRNFYKGTVTLRADVCINGKPCVPFEEEVDEVHGVPEDMKLAKERVMAKAHAYRDSLKDVVQ